MIDIEQWMARYEKAWASNDATDVARLFTEDAEYFTSPDASALVGRDEIVEWWLAEEEPVEPTFAWVTVAVTDDTAVVQARTDYPDEVTYLNLWIIHFEGDRARSFTEWYMVENDLEDEEDAAG